MKKWLQTAGYIVLIAAFAVVGILGCVGYPEAQEGVDIIKAEGWWPLSLILGGFGAAIATTVFGIANWMKDKVIVKKDKTKD
ncbi:MAG: hypothetical protein ACRC4M_04825 [Mycoplasma sp.]